MIVRRLIVFVLILFPTAIYGLIGCYDPYCRPPVRCWLGARATGIWMRDEIGNFPNLDRRETILAGFHAGIWYMRPCSLYLEAEGSLDNGSTHRSEQRLLQAKWRVDQWEVEGRLGFTAAFGMRCRWVFIPFTGYGFRSFTDRIDNLADLPLNPLGEIIRREQRQYETFYVPLGIKFLLQPGFCWEIGVTAEYQYSVDQSLWFKQLGELPPINPADPPILIENFAEFRFNLHPEGAWRIEVPITRKLGPTTLVQLDVTLIPYWQRVKYGDVTAVLPMLNFFFKDRIHYIWGIRLEGALRF